MFDNLFDDDGVDQGVYKKKKNNNEILDEVTREPASNTKNFSLMCRCKL